MEKYLKQYFFTVLLYILLHNNYRSWLHFFNICLVAWPVLVRWHINSLKGPKEYDRLHVILNRTISGREKSKRNLS